jgi:hypothetical protein
MAQELIRGIPVQYEPKRENRFFAEFPSELGIEIWKIQQFKAPTYTANSVEIPFINMVNYVEGQAKWEEMDIVLLDTIGPSTSQQVMEWVRLHTESLTGRQGYAAGYKKDIILKSLDPTGIEVEKWTLEQCMITSVDFGNNDMSSDEIKNITITVQPFRCILNV